MTPTPMFGREFSAARAAELRAQGGGRRRPPRRERAARRRWRGALGWMLISVGSRVLGAGAADDVAEEVTLR